MAAAPLTAALTVKVAINFDGSVDTRYRSGEKPIDPPASCSTVTCASKGNASGEIDQDGLDLLITATGQSDGSTFVEQSIDYAYVTRASGDAQICTTVPTTWTGHLEDFTGFMVGLTEGGSSTDWTAWIVRHNSGSLYFKSGFPGSSVTVVQGPNLPLPLHLCATFDDSTNLAAGYYSTDGVDYFQLGTVTRDLSNYRPFVGGTSHDESATTTAELTWDYSTEITIDDAGEPEPPAGAIHTYPASQNIFDCTQEGVQPGDHIVFEGTSRTSNVRIFNCVGTAQNPIVVRNDTTQNARFTHSVSGSGFKFELRNDKHLVVDGTGKWQGAPSGTCGINSSTLAEGRTQCGIRIIRQSGEPAHYIMLNGSSSAITIRGVEVDMNDGPGSGIKIGQSGQAEGGGVYLLSNHPNEWREDILIEHSYFHGNGPLGGTLGGGCTYLGQNYREDALRIRRITVRYNLIEDCGSDGLEIKGVIQGQRLGDGLWDSRVHHNVVRRTGRTATGGSVGNMALCYSMFETGYISVYNNFAEHCGMLNDSTQAPSTGEGSCYFQFIAEVELGDVAGGEMPSQWFNNVCRKPKGLGFTAGRSDSTLAVPNPEVWNNTLVDYGHSNCIRIGAALVTGLARDNICADNQSTTISAPSGATVSSNTQGTIASMQFEDAANGDFHLTTGSPARNTGAGPCPSFDIEDTARTGACDRGAYHAP